MCVFIFWNQNFIFKIIKYKKIYNSGELFFEILLKTSPPEKILYFYTFVRLKIKNVISLKKFGKKFYESLKKPFKKISRKFFLVVFYNQKKSLNKKLKISRSEISGLIKP